MKTVITLILVALCLLCKPAHAQDATFFTRSDFYRGYGTSQTLGLITPEIEAWWFQPQDVEVGRTWRVYQKDATLLMLGGYVSYWFNKQEFFTLPWLHAEYTPGKTRIFADVSGYIPWSDGPSIFFIDEIFVGKQVHPRLQIGIAGSLWRQNGIVFNWGAGPSAKYQVTKNMSLSGRVLLDNHGISSIRGQLTQNFDF